MRDPFWRVLLPVPVLLLAAVVSLAYGCLASLLVSCALAFVLGLAALRILVVQSCEALGIGGGRRG